MKHWAIIVLAAAAGCADMERQEAADAHATYEGRMARIRAKCVEYGFTQGTPDFGACVMQVDQRQQAAAAGVILPRVQQMVGR